MPGPTRFIEQPDGSTADLVAGTTAPRDGVELNAVTDADHGFLATYRAVIADIAHELSSPLAALLTNVSLARDDLVPCLEHSAPHQIRSLTSRAHSDLEDAIRLAGRIRKSIEFLSALSRSGDSDAKVDVTIVAATVGRVLHSLFPRVTFENEVVDCTPPVSGDSLGFAIAVAETLRRLLRYESMRGERVTLRVEQAERQLTLVADVYMTEPPLEPGLSPSQLQDCLDHVHAYLRANGIKLSVASIQIGHSTIRFELPTPKTSTTDA
jgi:signal transduction histidine kinase